MCRRQTLTTLSPAERSVAEQHYRLVEWYVRHRGLPVDEYLDVAVFGYLLAVKRWFARPDLYRYEFTTIACAAMRSAIGNEQRKQSRRIKTVSLDDPIPGTDGMTWEDIITEDRLVSVSYTHLLCRRVGAALLPVCRCCCIDADEFRKRVCG